MTKSESARVVICASRPGRGYNSAPKPIEALDNSILMVEARNESSRFPDGATVSWPRWSIPC
jgi:hypothetical protein